VDGDVRASFDDLALDLGHEQPPAPDGGERPAIAITSGRNRHDLDGHPGTTPGNELRDDGPLTPSEP
jgi:hypothetical protein